jgi:hypothetical protein
LGFCDQVTRVPIFFLFKKGDPFLIFFVSLAFVQSVKDEIFLLNERNKILELLQNIPNKMTRDDLHDLLEICSVHLNLTPISMREVFKYFFIFWLFQQN